MEETIYIIGAGIGGLATALCLQQQGLTIKVMESAPEIKPLGAGIVMANNAMQVFDQLGIREKVDAAGHKVSCMRITDAQFNDLSLIDLHPFEEQYGVHNTAIHRADLQRILADELGFEHIHLSKRLVDIDIEEAFTLRFEDETEKRGDIVIGADGIRSVVRQKLFPPSTIRDSGQICWRGICDLVLEEQYKHTALEAWGSGRRFGFVALNSRQVYWYAVANDDVSSADLSMLFKDFHPEVLEMIAATPADAVFFSRLCDLKPIGQWYHGKACLIGDAAHATTPNLGQGACQAVEDAYVLGKLFGKGLPVEQVFERYQSIRIQKAHQVVKTSWMIGKFSHWTNPVGIGIRNFVMKSLPASIRQAQLKPLFELSNG
ncbi:MAG TPA: FAD-dependent monooxygenase [Cyclobacteriaceae bacterium]|nr:FAD-dependent monooxygenase [Cyclobacteriaceae bacterium]